MRVHIPRAWGQYPAQSNHPTNVRVLTGFPVDGALKAVPRAEGKQDARKEVECL